jgi:hypothetical protein
VVLDPASLSRSGDAANGYTYSGSFYGITDRGFGSGSQNYHPRIQTMGFSIMPYYGSAAASQTQIVFSNTATMLLTYGGTVFTGFDPADPAGTVFPLAPTNSIGEGRRSLDSEGLARKADGSWFVSDEYAPGIYHFSATGDLLATLRVPDAFIPKRGNYPGTTAFAATNSLTSGRRSNRGFEALCLTPSGDRLVAMLQGPLLQDGGANNASQNDRVLMFDVAAGSATYGRVVAEYVYVLTLNGSAATNRQTTISEALALNEKDFLVIERDGWGLGEPGTNSPAYKSVSLVSVRGATNIANTGYDLERGAPSQVSLPTNSLPSSIRAVSKQDFVQIINTNELARYGLNIQTNWDNNTLPEKWEGLGLIPLQEPSAPDDYLLLVFSDNDFGASNVWHNGTIVGTNAITFDSFILAYRVTLPVNTTPSTNSLPSVVITSPTNATLAAPATFTLVASVYDQDGVITNVEFFEGSVKIGEDSTFPFQLPRTAVAAGNHDYSAVATDNSGVSVTSPVRTVVVTVDNLPPSVTISGPTNATLSAPAQFTLTATAGDADGSVAKVEFYEDTTKIGEKASAPYALTVTNVPAGMHSYIAVAIDNHGAMNTSTTLVVNVTANNLSPNVALLTPTNGFSAVQPVNITFTASASDPDGSISKMEYYRGSTKLGQATASPYTFTVTNFIAGTNTVYALAYDNQGATTASSGATIIIRDQTSPVIRCPTNILVECAATNGTPVTFTVTATDNNDTNVVISCTPPSGSLFPAGTNTVTCVATDAAGNSNTCMFQVIVLPSRVTIERAVIIRWNCGEVLQGADTVNGPWVDVPGATSPFCVPASEAKRFYRTVSRP